MSKEICLICDGKVSSGGSEPRACRIRMCNDGWGILSQEALLDKAEAYGWVQYNGNYYCNECAQKKENGGRR